MHIAAGVLFIIVAFANLTGGLIYAGLGSVVGMTGDAVESGAFSMTMTGEDGVKEEFEFQDEEAGGQIKAAGGMLTAWGLFLIVLGGLNIAAGVKLFTVKHATFIMVIAGLELLADIGTIVWAQTFIWSTIGIVAAVLAFLAAKSMAATAKSMAATQPAPEIAS